MKKQQIAAGALAVAMLVGMTGCGSASSAPTGASGTTEQAASTATAATGAITHLVMCFPTFTGAPADTQKVQDAMNAILRDKIGVEVELQISDLSSYKQSMTLALSGGEQIDLMNTIMMDYPSLVAQGSLTDLEENDLIQTYGQGILDAVGTDGIDACRLSGKLYALPSLRDHAQGRGCIAVATEYLDGIGYKAPEDSGEILHVTEDEINDLFAKLHAQYPDKEVFRPATSGLAQYTDVDMLGGEAFGVLLNYGADLKVEDLFASDTYMNFCKLIYDWNQKGYISKDAATDTTSVSSLMGSGTLMSYQTGGKPGSKAQETAGANGHDVTVFQTKDDFTASNGICSMPWVIPSNTVDATAAMKLMNEFYTDPDIANLLVYGIKDEHYKVMEDGCAQYITDSNGSTAYATLNWMAPDQFLTYVSEGNSPTLWDEMKAFNTDSKKSKALGFTFDGTSVSTEIAAVQSVYDEYQKSVEYGFVDPTVAIPEMDKKMMDAGLQKIIDEKQSQLDAWAAQKSTAE